MNSGARWKRRLFCLVGVVVAFGSLFWAFYTSSQQVPEFYREALDDPQVTPEVAEQVKLRAEQLVQDFQKNETKTNLWTESITEQECNSWLAYELPQHFPEVERQGISNSRLQFEKDRILLACRYKGTRLSGVVSIALRPRITDSNTLTLDVLEAKVGQIPLPVDRLITEAQKMAEQDKIPMDDVIVEWEPASGNTHSGRLTLKSTRPDELGFQAISIHITDNLLQISGEQPPVETAKSGDDQDEKEISIN